MTTTYVTIAQIANRMQVSETLLSDFVASGWLAAVEKNGLLFLHAHQEYKARFILHLRDQRNLSDDQIGRVLFAQTPPYNSIRSMPFWNAVERRPGSL